MSGTDLELLSRYTHQHAEEAFAELVQRHLGLVFSAALRQVRSPQLAEEVAQSVFTDLARNGTRLRPDTVLTAWLYQVTCRTAIDVIRREASRQLREQIATEMNAMNATAADWTHIEPLLDEAMHALDETDRAAVLLRYFENKSLREVGQTLGASENAAQKRLTRAVERLREFFAKRGVTVGASGLAVVISANAVQSAPVGLAVTISTAAALSGTTLVTTSTAVAAKTIVMTTLQKSVIGVALIAAVGVVIVGYRPRRASTPLPVPSISAETQTAENGAPDTVRPTAFEAASANAAATDPARDTLPQPAPTARDLYERGMMHQKEKRYDEALADLTKSIDLLEKGVGRWQWSPTPGAPVRDHRFDSLVATYSSRSSVYSDKKDYAKAIADLTRLLEFHPKDYSARFNRAQFLKYLGQMDAAIAEFTAIVENPDIDFSSNIERKEKLLAMTHEYRGGIYQERKEYDRAIADYTESIRQDPSGGSGMIVYWHRGLAYRASQQIDKALEDANHLSQWALQWATAGKSKDSDRDRALTAARFGSEIFEHQRPFQLEVLAAVKARAGDFWQAIREQERAITLLTPVTEDQRPAMQARLDLYKAGKPLPRE